MANGLRVPGVSGTLEIVEVPRFSEVEGMKSLLGLDELPFVEGKWTQDDRERLLALPHPILALVVTVRNLTRFWGALARINPNMTMEEAQLRYFIVVRYFNARATRRILAGALAAK